MGLHASPFEIEQMIRKLDELDKFRSVSHYPDYETYLIKPYMEDIDVTFAKHIEEYRVRSLRATSAPWSLIMSESTPRDLGMTWLAHDDRGNMRSMRRAGRPLYSALGRFLV